MPLRHSLGHSKSSAPGLPDRHTERRHQFEQARLSCALQFANQNGCAIVAPRLGRWFNTVSRAQEERLWVHRQRWRCVRAESETCSIANYNRTQTRLLHVSADSLIVLILCLYVCVCILQTDYVYANWIPSTSSHLDSCLLGDGLTDGHRTWPKFNGHYSQWALCSRELGQVRSVIGQFFYIHVACGPDLFHSRPQLCKRFMLKDDAPPILQFHHLLSENRGVILVH